MSTRMTRSTRLPAAAPIVLGMALLLAGYGNLNASAANTIPLPGARVVKQQPVCAHYKTYGVPRVTPVNPRRTYKATVTTNKGTFTITFYPRVAPIAVESFLFLAQRHYFDGVSFHRVVPTFVIQGGDPTGSGECGPGYEFKNEKVTQPYARGIVAMANAGLNTNGSQFFIMLQNNSLPPNYTIFGKVTSGMNTIDRLTSVQLGPGSDGTNSSPLTKIYMKSVRVTES